MGYFGQFERTVETNNRTEYPVKVDLLQVLQYYSRVKVDLLQVWDNSSREAYTALIAYTVLITLHSLHCTHYTALIALQVWDKERRPRYDSYILYTLYDSTAVHNPQYTPHTHTAPLYAPYCTTVRTYCTTVRTILSPLYPTRRYDALHRELAAVDGGSISLDALYLHVLRCIAQYEECMFNHYYFVLGMVYVPGALVRHVHSLYTVLTIHCTHHTLYSLCSLYSYTRYGMCYSTRPTNLPPVCSP
jgi:hypothetical protein